MEPVNPSGQERWQLKAAIYVSSQHGGRPRLPRDLRLSPARARGEQAGLARARQAGCLAGRRDSSALDSNTAWPARHARPLAALRARRARR